MRVLKVEKVVSSFVWRAERREERVAREIERFGGCLPGAAAISFERVSRSDWRVVWVQPRDFFSASMRSRD